MGLISRVSSRTYRKFSSKMHRRGQPIVKPETAFSQATEFVHVEHHESALQCLQDFLKNRRQRQWTPTHPKIMSLYIDLCIKLRKSQVAKEGLYQCKAMTQHQYPEELENIIKEYLKKAQQRVSEAKKESSESTM